MSETKLPIHFEGYTEYLCLVCSGGPADRHVLTQQADGHYYGGISFHSKCFDIEAALREARDAS